MKAFAGSTKNIFPVILIAILLCIGIFFRHNVFADEALPEDKLSQWKTLTPEDKDGLRRSYKLWKDLKDDEKQKILGNFKGFKSFSQKEQVRITTNYNIFISMDSAQQKVIMRQSGGMQFLY